VADASAMGEHGEGPRGRRCGCDRGGGGLRLGGFQGCSVCHLGT
jgi:hypothetical protein